MNSTKLLLSTLVGAIVNFLAGWGIYGYLLTSSMESGMSTAAKAIMKPMDQHLIHYYFFGSIFFALIFAYLYERWANIRTFQTGAMVGVIVSILFSLSLDCGYLASLDMYTNNSMILINALAYGIMGGLTGGAVGWMLGYNRTS